MTVTPIAYPVIKGKVPGPWAVIIYGAAGLGKSTWASSAPKPLFLDLEDGLARIDCERTPVITTMDELTKAIQYAAASEYKTVVFDTADALEKLLTTHVCQKGQKDSLSDFGYGKGEVALRAEWTRIINVVLRLKAKGKNVIMTAHEQIQKLDDPSSDSYDRYTLNLDKRAAPAVVAAMDGVFFARHEMIVRPRDEDKGGKNRAVGTGKRVMHTTETPAWVSKNRFGLPPTVALSPALFSKLDECETKNEPTNQE